MSVVYLVSKDMRRKKQRWYKTKSRAEHPGQNMEELDKNPKIKML